jgi:serine/threonine-protein kinase
MGATSQEQARLLQDIGLPDRYPVVRRIARGGMASVWCARDLVLDRDVAIKLLSEPFLHDAAAVHRFQREARAAAHLSGHANVVTIFDVGQGESSEAEETGRPFIVMEYLSGGTVADALRVGEVSRDDALQWLQQAADALDYAHGRGVVHRDIKPANLLLNGRRVLHVADFGIARVGTEDPITSTGQLFGTAAYFSPEQAMGRPATAASDRYALAVVAYELLVGERPFTAEHFAAQARQHVEARPPAASERNPGLPRALDAVLARGMAKAPEARWPSAREFAEAVKGALAERPARAAAAGPARPVFATHRSSRGGPRAPRAIALAALAAGVIALAAALAAGGGGSAPTLKATHATTGGAAARTSARKGKPAAKKHAAQSTATTPAGAAPAEPAAPASGGTPAPASGSSPASAASLEARGHQLMVSGDYGGAIPVLRQAVAAGPGSGLTYAYALYDLGHSLRLAGDPRAAAVVLQQRLQIPNQTDVVRQELQLALRAIGTQVNATAAGNGHDKGRGGGGSGD